jgi:hypothetical protein
MAVKIETYTHLSRINDAVDCTIYIESVTQIGLPTFIELLHLTLNG